MITFILIVSLILHCVSILAIIILYSRQNQYKETEQHIEKMKKELEDVLQSFAMELEESNNEMKDAISQMGSMKKSANPMRPETKPSDNKLQPLNRMGAKEEQPMDLSVNSKQADSYEGLVNEVTDQVELSHANVEPNKSIEQEKHGFKDLLKQQLKSEKQLTLPEQVMKMKNDGLTEEEIAKQLGKGKTEIELLVKFHA
ncbi:hypothetical protein [Bacillus sp. 1P06AnD]|uniref:hypothetical protein n=1 Tax=Bacillus sp. 1P06AnD TaxID=3132208 RepID=UPI0039A28127